MTPAKRRIPAVEGARGVAALSVLTFHSLQAHGVGGPVAGRLWLGVPLFFVISGFVLFKPFCAAILAGGERPSLHRYAWARALRIFPALWAMTAVALLVLYPSARGGVFLTGAVGIALASILRPPRRASVRVSAYALAVALGTAGVALATGADPYSTTTAFDQFTLLQLFTLAKPVVLVGPVWTLCIEVGFYALLPFLALAMMRTAARTSRHRPAAVVLASLAALAGFGLLYNQFMGWGYGLPTTVLGFLPQFAAGMALAVAVELRVFRSAGRQLLIAAAVVAAVALAIQNLGPANNTEGSGPLFGAAIAIAFALALAAVVLPERPLLLSQALSSRLLVWLGTISYGIYLWHYPVILWLGDHESTSTVAGLGLTIALTVALAVLSWRAVESPAMQLQRRGLLSRRGAVAPEGPAAPARRTPAPEATR